jgi:hypothetical protein
VNPEEIAIPESVVSDTLTANDDTIAPVLVVTDAESALVLVSFTRWLPLIDIEAASATPARPTDPTNAEANNSSFFHNYSF